MPLTHLRRPRLSYANVTATLALVIATSTGGAYAAATIGSSQIKNDAVKSRHISAGNVKTADLADGGVTAGKLGPDVAAARAFGTVFHTGGVANAQGMASENVVRGGTGVYCISGLSFTPRIAVASSTLEPNAFHHDVEIYGIGGNFASEAPCPAGTQLQIRVYQPGTTTEANGNFNIVIH